jgi:putative membrane protein
MHTPTTLRACSVAAALLLAACGQNARSTSNGANPAEVRFTTNAYQIIEFDRQEGALAQTEAKNPQVKALAQQLTAQADAFAARLAPSAADAGITPPRVLRNDLRVRLGHMRLQQGLDFDRAYVADQIASHEEVLRMENGMTNEGVSPQYRTLMTQGNALLQTNLDRLRALQAQIGTARS